MPQLLGHPADENTQILPDSHLHLYDTKQNLWSRTLNKLGVSSWLRKDGEALAGGIAHGEEEVLPCQRTMSQDRPNPSRRPARTVVPSLPRPITFRRQNSERRERLMEYEPDVEEKRKDRRAVSMDRRAMPIPRTHSPTPCPLPVSSAPDVCDSHNMDAFGSYERRGQSTSNSGQTDDERDQNMPDRPQPRDIPRLMTDFPRT